jgi:hypothetical protein
MAVIDPKKLRIGVKNAGISDEKDRIVENKQSIRMTSNKLQ